MSEIILTTLNAKYIHASFGLRYLLANMGELQHQTELMEFDIKSNPSDIAEDLLQRNPKIVGLGIYIWNAEQSLKVVRLLKQLKPEIKLILGGPEVSYEYQDQPIVESADFLITGEADFEFSRLCRRLLNNDRLEQKVFHAPLPDVNKLRLPYEYYNSEDLAHRVIYVEASRGCPFKCEFCLSSLDIPVRPFDTSKFMNEMEDLMKRGMTRFKFVDRTFNLSTQTGSKLLTFFLERYREGMFLHFEMIPDRLPVELRKLISQFPKGALQFEIGIQTFNPEVATRIHRRQNYSHIDGNLLYLKQQTGVYLHVDLIVGLPGEDLESFGSGFDHLVSLRPHEIQVGILKRLKGTPIGRHDDKWGMCYNDHPPFDLLFNHSLNFQTMQRLKRFARYWDLTANSGRFVQSVTLIWGNSESPFREFMKWSDWLYLKIGRSHAISLTSLMKFLLEYLVSEKGIPDKQVAESILDDYRNTGHLDTPRFLAKHFPKEINSGRYQKLRYSPLSKRQHRHLS